MMHIPFIFVFSLISLPIVSSFPIPNESVSKTSLSDTKEEDTKQAEIRKIFLKHGSSLTDADLIQVRDKLKNLNVNVRRSFDPIEATIKVPDRKGVVYEEGEDAFKDVWELNEEIADYLYQSDILLTPKQLDDIVVINSRQKRMAKSDPIYKWPTTTPIPYIFADNLGQNKKNAIENALKFWQDHTCVRFQQNAPGVDSLKFINSTGCYSNIGRTTGQQDISIGDGCEYLGITAHEIGHALGFYHEMSRYDRDDFLSINLTNVDRDMIRNFDVTARDDMNIYGVPFEYGSVMGYSSASFAIDKNVPVLVPLDPLFLQSMGQRTGPSFLDVLQMNKHYGCFATCKNSETSCSRGGYPNPNDCSKCLCPMGFGEPSCDGRQPSQNADCGGNLLATDAWQELSSSLGENKTISPIICIWHITAPNNNSLVELKITELNAKCHSGCAHNALQVKSRRNFQPTGYRQCCKEDNKGHVYKSETTIMPVIAEAFIRMNFTLEYRSVTSSSTTATVNIVTPGPFSNPKATKNSSRLFGTGIICVFIAFFTMLIVK